MIIFRGRGKGIKETERLAYHPDVDIYFQKNAWADTEVFVQWVNKTLAKAVEGLDHYSLFLDNLTAQQTTDFKEARAHKTEFAGSGYQMALICGRLLMLGSHNS